MLSLCLCSTLSHFSPGIKVVGGFVKESCFRWVNIANEMQNSRLNSKCFHGLELKPGGCLWRFCAAHLFDLYFFQEKTNRPLWSFSASFCFIFMQLQSHSHVGAAQYEHALLMLATEQLCRTDVPKSKECRHHGALAARWMSSSSSSSGLMNTPPLLSLFGVPEYWVVTIALIFFQGSYFIYCNSLQLLRSWFLWCVHSHTPAIEISSVEFRLMKSPLP